MKEEIYGFVGVGALGSQAWPVLRQATRAGSSIVGLCAFCSSGRCAERRVSVSVGRIPTIEITQHGRPLQYSVRPAHMRLVQVLRTGDDIGLGEIQFGIAG